MSKEVGAFIKSGAIYKSVKRVRELMKCELCFNELCQNRHLYTTYIYIYIYIYIWNQISRIFLEQKNDILRIFLEHKWVTVKFYDVVNMIHDVITTAYPFPYTAKFTFVGDKNNKTQQIKR